MFASFCSWAALLTLSVLLIAPIRIQSSTCYLNFRQNEYPSCAQISPNVSLHWSIRDGSITWAVDVDGVWDWVGIGISEGGMLGADIAVVSHDTTAHQFIAEDYWSTGFRYPQLDKQQDVTLQYIERHASTNKNGSTLVAMRRPLVTCDPAGQDRPILNDTQQTVIFAYGTGEFGYHGTINRGEYDLVFIPNTTAAAAAAGASIPPSSVPSLQTLDLTMPAGFVVPADATSYMCVNLAMPNATKFHIYRQTPIIDARPLVHHFVVYSCRGDAPPVTPLGTPYDCLQYMECEDFYLGWAPGVGAVDSPAQAALPFGSGSGILYVALQIHYNNPDGITGQTDSSGFQLSYSSVLKPYDMGVLTLGSYAIAVPPAAATWSTPPNVCPGSCTARLAAGATPANTNATNSTSGNSSAASAGAGAGTGGGTGTGVGSVTLVESFYHMHMLGRQIVTRHVRGGVELPPLGSRDYFDFAYQRPTGIPLDTRQLLPGDVLITTCTYSGAGRNQTTTFGLASNQEMCFNFLTYYPDNPALTECVAVNGSLAVCGNDESQVVPIPANATTFKPYQPTCKRTAPPAPSPAIPDKGTEEDDDNDHDDDKSSSSSSSSHHRRNVGGAVAAILVVTLAGAVAIVAVYRTMKKKQQAEEEKHLFEKYNPNSLILPMTAVPLTTTATSAAIGSSSSAAAEEATGGVGPGPGRGAGDEGTAVGSTTGGGGGILGKGYSAVPNEIRSV